MVAKLFEWIRGDAPAQDDIPVCEDHHVEMVLHSKLGKPARFQDQETQTYTLIYRCPVPGCGNAAERTRVRNQIPAPGQRTQRPPWASKDNKGL